MVRRKKFKNQKQYVEWVNLKSKSFNIPANPHIVYLNKGWLNWPDWLGTNPRHAKNREYKLFEEAKAYVHKLRFSKISEYVEWLKSSESPPDIPSMPNRVYENEWLSWGDWLGTNSVASYKKKFKSFEEARNFVRQLAMRSKNEYKDWAKSDRKPDTIPSNPRQTYHEEWLGWGDWLGTGTIASFDKEFKAFDEARQNVRTLNLLTRKEYRNWINSEERCGDIPSNPDIYYKNKGWLNWQDWLGSDFVSTRNRKYKDFEEARVYVIGLNFETQTDYKAWSKSGNRPADIPSQPNRVYKEKGWLDWSHWLGSDKRYLTKNRNFLNFYIARSFTRSLNLKSINEYYSWAKTSKRPLNIPYSPDRTYKNKGWVDWYDWLGKPRPGEEPYSSS